MDARRNNEAKLTLPSDREILIVRDFKARKSLVFDLWSKPEHVLRWYVCEGMTLPVCEVDLRVGGNWRWVMREAGGRDHAVSGKYLRITRPDLLEFSEVYEPIPGSDHVVTLTFEELNGVTTLTQRILHTSKEMRDGHLQSGMENGMQDGFRRFDGVLESLKASL